DPSLGIQSQSRTPRRAGGGQRGPAPCGPASHVPVELEARHNERRGPRRARGGRRSPPRPCRPAPVDLGGYPRCGGPTIPLAPFFTPQECDKEAAPRRAARACVHERSVVFI